MSSVKFLPRLGEDGRKRVLIVFLALLAAGLYVGLSSAGGQVGFPLDDSWIHQTYARNLAETGRWEYVNGQVSAGSTAPLWTLMLAVGYFLRLPYLLWAYLLGGLCLAWLGLAGMALWQTLWPQRQKYGWLTGVVLVFTWPLVWAAASGMETVLFAALGLQILVLYSWLAAGSLANRSISNNRLTAALGFLCGLLILVRPDGLGLLLLIIAGLWSVPANNRLRLAYTAVFILAAVLPLLPYFAFNLSSSGHWWPNTFYAKQAEYAFLWETALPVRFAQLLYFSLGGPAEGLRGVSGAHLLLLPGLLLAGWMAVRHDWQQRRLFYLLPLLWAGGHILLYAWRLPVTYQHGRYLWPALPVWILYGLAGWQELSILVKARLAGIVRFEFMWRMVTTITFALLLLAFLMLGAQVYTFDVGVINGEMVAVGRWLAENTPAEALIAAHDIGAIGYFAERPLLDLAGLISPQVVEWLADEEALSDFVWDSSADYLVTAPGWPYLALTNSDQTVLLYDTNYLPTQQQGFNNMAVYLLNRP